MKRQYPRLRAGSDTLPSENLHSHEGVSFPAGNVVIVAARIDGKEGMIAKICRTELFQAQMCKVPAEIFPKGRFLRIVAVAVHNHAIEVIVLHFLANICNIGIKLVFLGNTGGYHVTV